ncbi:DEAD-box ATP-dependent RNA helicase 6 [Platanthera guangdongensis]|uniref:DEAD-box ATP-dependent RNA helicase 6 n=1 Tax=Platanthera guangdongensis TaxID=2320717 RepID=A0ABR2LNW7_9ASPA
MAVFPVLLSSEVLKETWPRVPSLFPHIEMVSGISDLEQPKISFSRISKQDVSGSSRIVLFQSINFIRTKGLLKDIVIVQLPGIRCPTLSFSAPLNLTDFIPGRHPTDFKFQLIVAIMVPTRELSLQASQVCKELRKHLNVQVMVTTRRTSLKDDIKLLYQPAHLIVGTPGQIQDQCC